MSEQTKQEGVILKKIPYSDADEIITVLLKEDGVRRFFVSGSRKSKKKYAGLIDHFAHLNFLYQSSSKQLWRLRDVDQISKKTLPKHFWQRDLKAYAFFNYLSELICEFSWEEMHANDLYEIWQRSFEYFEEKEFSHVEGLYFLLQIFASFGYAFELETCVLCQNTNAKERVAFLPEQGGMVCQSCVGQKSLSHSFVVSSELLLALNGDFFISQNSQLEKEAVGLFRLLIKFSHQIMHKKTKAEEFLLQMLA